MHYNSLKYSALQMKIFLTFFVFFLHESGIFRTFTSTKTQRI